MLGSWRCEVTPAFRRLRARGGVETCVSADPQQHGETTMAGKHGSGRQPIHEVAVLPREL